MAIGATAALPASLAALIPDLSAGRPNPSDRRFSSAAIEAVIAAMKQQIADPVLSKMFEQCFPNTLDTTVFPETLEGMPDTFVIWATSTPCGCAIRPRRCGRMCNSPRRTHNSPRSSKASSAVTLV